MKIGVFAERIGSAGGGVETYELGLIKGLMNIDRDNHYTIYFSSECFCMENLCNNTNFVFKSVNEKSKVLRFIIGIPYKLLTNKEDIVHVCSIPPLFNPRKYVMTVHDLCSFIHREFFPWQIRQRLNYFLTKGIQNAAKIITVSESTRKDLIELFGIHPSKLSVIHLGLDRQYRPVEDKNAVRLTLDKYGIPPNYILYIGKIQSRKNIIGLLQVFYILKNKYKVPHKLVMVGRSLWNTKREFQEIERLGIKDDVIQTGHVPYSDLPAMYSGADVFVFPSFYEGFGLPPLEAMACGVPVVTSNTTALPEVLGDAALMDFPTNVEGLAQKVFLLLNDEHLRNTMREKGLKRASLFSWEETARKTLDVYKDLYHDN